MAKALVESIELPPLKEDYAFHPQTIPGDPLYERLKVENPQVLQQILEEERLAARSMNTPESLAFLRESDRRGRDKMLHEYATHGPYYYWYQEHVKGKHQTTQADRNILGLNQSETLHKKDVRNAYRRQARKLHPDTGGDPEAFKTLYAAYRTLLTVAKD